MKAKTLVFIVWISSFVAAYLMKDKMAILGEIQAVYAYSFIAHVVACVVCLLIGLKSVVK